MRLTDDERVALVKARYLRAPNTLEDDPQQSAIEAAVEAILTARLAEAWDKGFGEGAIAAHGLIALDNPYRAALTPEATPISGEVLHRKPPPPPTPEQLTYLRAEFPEATP